MKLGGTHRLWSYTLNETVFAILSPLTRFYIKLYSSSYKTTTKIENTFNTASYTGWVKSIDTPS